MTLSFPALTRWILLRLRSRSVLRWVRRTGFSHWTIVDLNGRPRRAPRKSVPTTNAKEENSRPDLVVFLDLVDGLSEEEFSRLLTSLACRRVLFSFTERSPNWRPFPNTNELEATGIISSTLRRHGYRRQEIRRLPWSSRGRLVLAERADSSLV